MKEIIFFLEDARSAQAMLEGILDKVLTTAKVEKRFIPFEGKQDLEKKHSQTLAWILESRGALYYFA